MRIVFLWCLLVSVALPGLAHFDFTFDTNATISDDPFGRQNPRNVSHSFNSDTMRYIFRSTRREPPLGALEPQLDTIGGLITYKTLPVALMAYWNGNGSWGLANSDVTSSLTAVGMAFTTIIERDAQDSIVRTYPLSRIISNVSAGIDWNVSAETDETSSAHWVHMDARVPIPSTQSFFDLETVWFLSSESGVIDYGNTTLSPRRLECIIRISNYLYATPGNTLSLRVLASYPTTNFSASNGYVYSGSGISLTSVNINTHGQVLDQAGSITGTMVPVSISDWEPSPGLRNAVYNSDVGCYLNTKYGLNWDAKVADVTFPTDAHNLLFSSSLGYTVPVHTPSSPFPAPLSNSPDVDEINSPSRASSLTAFSGFDFCIISMVIFVFLL